MSAYRKLDPMGQKAPRLYVSILEKKETDREIRSAVSYCNNDNYLAVAFGVDQSRVANIREKVEAETKTARPYEYSWVRRDKMEGIEGLKLFRRSCEQSSGLLHKRIMKAYERRAKQDGISLNEAAFAMGMRP